MTERSFSPDWVSPPGDTIADVLEDRGWTQADLAERTGFTKKHINLLIQGRAPLTPETASKLANVLGSSTEFWLRREASYRATLEHRRRSGELEAQQDWLNELPLDWMFKKGLIDKDKQPAERVEAALRYFSVGSVAAWRDVYGEPLAAFRASERYERRVGAVATWLRAAEMAAADIQCRPFDRDGFEAALLDLRALSAEHDPAVFVPRMQQACAAHGVAVVFVPAPPKCPIHGATRWLTPEKALVALSLRYKTNDHLWFTFFHECGHLLKHGKKLLFIEGLNGLNAEQEAEANRFAADLLIPPAEIKVLKGLRAKDAVCAFAARIGIAPGIVVGRMQHDGWLPRDHLNGLKVSYTWSESDDA